MIWVTLGLALMMWGVLVAVVLMFLKSGTDWDDS